MLYTVLYTDSSKTSLFFFTFYLVMEASLSVSQTFCLSNCTPILSVLKYFALDAGCEPGTAVVWWSISEPSHLLKLKPSKHLVSTVSMYQYTVAEMQEKISVNP